jgi:hypothetical protein
MHAALLVNRHAAGHVNKHRITSEDAALKRKLFVT